MNFKTTLSLLCACTIAASAQAADPAKQFTSDKYGWHLPYIGRFHGDFLHATVLDVAELHAGEGLAFTRLHVLGFSDDARIVIDQNLLAGLDVVHTQSGHGRNLLKLGVEATCRNRIKWCTRAVRPESDRQ